MHIASLVQDVEYIVAHWNEYNVPVVEQVVLWPEGSLAILAFKVNSQVYVI